MTNQDLKTRIANKAGRVEARREKLKRPDEPRVGFIKLGVMQKKCYNKPGGSTCGQEVLASVKSCPKCGETNWSHTFPRKANSFKFKGDGVPSAGHLRFTGDVTEIPMTFKDWPHKCVMIRRENYRGGQLFCSSVFRFNLQAGDYVETGIANRMNEGEIKCDPLKCPYSVGGNITESAKTIKIDPDRAWCGEKVLLNVWVPDLPGFSTYQMKSGSRTTINNVQSIVKTLTHLFQSAGGHFAIRLMLKMKAAQTSYPAAGGGWKPAKFKTFIIDPPFSVADMIEQARIGQLRQDEIQYVLPTGQGSRQLALPAAGEGTYDELIDSPNDPDAKAEEPQPGHERITKVSDLETQDRPKFVQEVKITKEQRGRFLEVKRELNSSRDDQSRRRLNATIAKTWDIEMTRGKLRFGDLSKEKAEQVITWMEQLKDRQLRLAAESEKSWDEIDDDLALIRLEKQKKRDGEKTDVR